MVKTDFKLKCEGAMVERLCSGLQLRVRRFESGSRLQLDNFTVKYILSARMVESVDTRDLKSLALWVSQFESGFGHQLTT